MSLDSTSTMPKRSCQPSCCCCLPVECARDRKLSTWAPQQRGKAAGATERAGTIVLSFEYGRLCHQVEVAVLKMYNMINKRLPSWQDPPSSSKIRVRGSGCNPVLHASEPSLAPEQLDSIHTEATFVTQRSSVWTSGDCIRTLSLYTSVTTQMSPDTTCECGNMFRLRIAGCFAGGV